MARSALILLLLAVPASATDPAREVERLRQLLTLTTYQHRLDLARREWHAGNVLRAQILLDDCPEPVRGFEWRYLDQLVRGSALTSVVPEAGLCVGWSDGPTVVTPRGLGVAARRAVVSPDGTTIAVAAGDEIVLLGTKKVQPARRLAAPAAPVLDLAFSPDSQRLAVLAGNTVRVCAVATGEEVFAVSLVSPATCLDVGRGDRLAVGCANGTVSVWDVPAGRFVAQLYLPTAVTQVRLHPEGRTVAVVAGEHLRVVSLAGTVTDPAGASVGVTSAAWSPDGLRLAAGVGHVIHVWDSTGRTLLETHRGHAGRVQHVAFSPDALQLASYSEDRILKVWEVPGQPAGVTFAAHQGRISAMAWSPAGERLATAGGDTVRLWDTATRANPVTLGTHPAPVTCLAYAPDGKQLATGCADGVLRTWDAATGKPIEALAGFTKALTAVAWSPDGNDLAGIAEDGLLQVQRRGTGKVDRVQLPRPGAFGLAYRPDGTQLAIGCSDLSDVAVRLFEPRTLRPLQEFTGPRALPAVAWSPDGSLLAFASSTGTRLLRRAGTPGEVVLRDMGGTFDAAAGLTFSPDGTRLATSGSGRPLRIWDTTTGLELFALTDAYTGDAIAFSPEGDRLALGDPAGTVRIAVGPRRPQPRSFADSSYHLAFAPDGRWMVTGVRQPAHLLQVWDLRTGEQGAVLDTIGGGLLSQQVHFSPESNRVRTLQEARVGDGSRFFVRSWDVTTGREAARTLIEPPGQVIHWHWIGTHVAVASISGETLTLRVWDALTGKLIQTLPEVGPRLTSIRLSPDGTTLLVTAQTVSGTLTSLWEVGSGKRKLTALETAFGPAARLERPAFRPDGLALAGYVTAGKESQRVVWSLRTGDVVHKQTVERAGGPLVFSPDGAYLVELDGGLVRAHATTENPGLVLPVAPQVPFQGDHLAFTPDGKHLAVQGTRGDTSRLYLWPFPTATAARPESPPVGVAPAVAQRDLVTLTLREQRWFAAEFHLSRLLTLQKDAPDLHRLRGRAIVGQGDHARAVPDLKTALTAHGGGIGVGFTAADWQALAPHLAGDDWPTLALRGHAHAGQGDWSAAVQSFARAVQAGGRQPTVVSRQAYAALAAGDAPRYRKVAEQLLADFGAPKDATTANNVAWACLLGTGVKPEVPIKLALRAVEAAAQAPGATRHAYLNTLALGQYRAGNYEDAERLVHAAIEANGHRATRLDRLLLALALGKLEKKEAGRVALAEALRDLEADLNLRGSWEARLEVAVLRGEAEALLRK